MERKTRIYRQSTRGVASFCQYHIVWCTRYRRDLLASPVKERMEEEIPRLCKEQGYTLRRLLVYPDWIGITVEVPPDVSPRQVLAKVRIPCAQIMHREYPKVVARTSSVFPLEYFVTTQEEFPTHAVATWIRRRSRGSETRQRQVEGYKHVKRIRLE